MRGKILFILILLLATDTITAGGWWNDNWKHRVTVIITENSGKDLEDYQVFVELNKTNFEFEKALPHGEDIRFIDSGRELSYWIEEWDSVKEKAKIWVKIPRIPAYGEKVIYLYYGNLDAENRSDGDETFEFFDDCDDFLDWTQLDWTQNKEDKFHYKYIARYQNTYQSLDFVIKSTDSFVITATAKDIDSHYSAWTHHGMQFFGLSEDTEFNHYSLFGLDYGGGADGYNSILKSSVDRHEKYTSVDAPKNTLLRWEIIKDDSDWTFKSTRVDTDVELYSYSTRFSAPAFRYIGFRSISSDRTSADRTITSKLYDGGMRFRCVGETGNTADVVYYNIFVRKYTDPEPTVTIGDTDLYLTSVDIFFSRSSSGQEVEITAEIHCMGDVNLSNVLVYFYDGDPERRGRKIGWARIPYIEADSSEKAVINWTASETTDIYVLIDPEDEVAETDEDNNVAFRRLDVGGPDYLMYLAVGAIIVLCLLGLIILFTVYKILTYKKQVKDEESIECPRCGMILPMGTRECPVCGNEIK